MWSQKWPPYSRNCRSEHQWDFTSPASLDTELHPWQVMWMSKRDAPSSMQEALEKCDSTFFPNIKRILVISSTFPVTSCECERSISTLRLLKTYLRSTMHQDRMNALALMYVHRDIAISCGEIAQEFAIRQPRRLLLPNMFMDKWLATILPL